MMRNNFKRIYSGHRRFVLMLQLILMAAACDSPDQSNPSTDLGSAASAGIQLRLSVGGLWAEVRSLEVQAYLQPATATDLGVSGALVPLQELALGLYSLTLPFGTNGVLTVAITGLDRTLCRVGSGRRDVWIDQASSSEVGIAIIRSPVRNCPLTVIRGGDGSGKVSSDPAGIDCGPRCSGYFDEGSLVALSANPDATSLSTWAGPCELIKGSVCNVRIQGKTAVDVLFVANALSIKKIGAGMGQVVSDPPGIDCGAACQVSLPRGTRVKLTALPANLSVFAGWGGACSGTSDVCVLTLDGAAAATADFEVCSAEFCQFASGTDKELYRVWGSAANDVWAVGFGGAILHWDGSRWTAKASGTTDPFYGVWGSAANDVWAVGSKGMILHWDGGSWTTKVSSPSNHLRAVWGQASQVWVAGAAGVIFFHK